jgi:hypothetical protein
MNAVRLAGHPGGVLLLALAVALGATARPAPAAVVLPTGGSVERVDFERHLMGVFGRAGCNNGSCHGSFQGKGGFRLSLFGYDPEKDFTALTRDQFGRRIDPVDPDRSLLLLKATGQVAHEGGQRFGQGSWQYQLFRDWLRSGAEWRKGSGDVAALTVTPPEAAFGKPGETGQLEVRAKFADGTEEDVTAFCDFRIADDAVAEVTPLGKLKSVRAGDTACTVIYRGNVQAVRVLVPMPAAPGFVYPSLPEVNFIDREVLAKLRRLNMVPSELAGDAEFLRRLTIDVTGSLPTPDEVRAFLADPKPDKRVRTIDELLASPRHAGLWATKLDDITGNNTDALENPQQLRPKRSQMWHDWFARRIRENRPYDEIVRGVLCATSRDGRSPEEWLAEVKKIDAELEKGFGDSYADRPSLDLFWRRQQAVPPEQWGEKTAAAFLGVRLECAQCHKHPTDRWTQADYRSYANLFTAVAVGVSPESKKLVDAENAERNKQATDPKQKQQVVPVRELFVGANGKVQRFTHPDTGKPLPAKALGGPEISAGPGQDPREELFRWMDRPDNPFFARSFANRVWAHYFGVGLVEPVDDFSLANPPSNAKLLDALADEFRSSGYDIRKLERTILLSRTYQLSAVPNETNRLDRNNFARAYVRPMMAEVVVDVLNDALGATETYGTDAPAGRRMTEVGASRLQANPNLMYALRIFGRPPRTTACDCERAMGPALPQTLYRMTDPGIQAKLQSKIGRAAQLAAGNLSDERCLEELFLAALARPPHPDERAVFARHRAAQKDRRAALADTLWALVNTREFILNH